MCVIYICSILVKEARSDKLVIRGHCVIDKFFPIVNNKDSDKWKNVARNKLKYMSYIKKHMNNFIEKNLFQNEIKFIEKIFKEKYFKFYNSRRNKITRDVNKIYGGRIIITKNYNSYNKTYILKNNIFVKTIFKISKLLYNKLVYWIDSDKLKDGVTKNKIIFLLLLRYEKLLYSKNHQLGIKYKQYKINKYDVELFASPINRTLKFFCSAYPDIDKYFRGNKRSIWDYKLESYKKYTMNPPYIDPLMINAVKYILGELDRPDIKNISIFITIPIWDKNTIKQIAEETKDQITGKYKEPYNNLLDSDNEWEDYVPYLMLKKSKYLDRIDVHGMDSYSYWDHVLCKSISVSSTFHIILKKE